MECFRWMCAALGHCLAQDVGGFICFDLGMNSLLGLAIVLVSNPGLYENLMFAFFLFFNCKHDKLEKHDPSENKSNKKMLI